VGELEGDGDHIVPIVDRSESKESIEKRHLIHDGGTIGSGIGEKEEEGGRKGKGGILGDDEIEGGNEGDEEDVVPEREVHVSDATDHDVDR